MIHLCQFRLQSTQTSLAGDSPVGMVPVYSAPSSQPLHRGHAGMWSSMSRVGWESDCCMLHVSYCLLVCGLLGSLASLCELEQPPGYYNPCESSESGSRKGFLTLSFSLPWFCVVWVMVIGKATIFARCSLRLRQSQTCFCPALLGVYTAYQAMERPVLIILPSSVMQ